MFKLIGKKKRLDELFKVFFWYLEDRYFLEALSLFANGIGYRRDSVSCNFCWEYSKDDENYFGDTGVRISENIPGTEEEIYEIVSFKKFYSYLFDESVNYSNRFPEEINEVTDYLFNIRKRLNLQ